MEGRVAIIQLKKETMSKISTNRVEISRAHGGSWQAAPANIEYLQACQQQQQDESGLRNARSHTDLNVTQY